MERVTARAAEMANHVGQPWVGQALITRAALARAGKDMAERQLVGASLAASYTAWPAPAASGTGV